MTENLDLEAFKLSQCIEWIQSHGFKRVGLIIPKDLLQWAAEIYFEISLKVTSTVLIFGDYKIRGCCANEQAAKGYVDAVIHFGSSCLTPSSNAHVLYTLAPSLLFNVDNVIDLLKKNGCAGNENLILTFDSICSEINEQQIESLQSHFPNLLASALNVATNVDIIWNGTIRQGSDFSNVDAFHFQSRKVILSANLNIESYSFVHIGPSNETLQTLQYKFPQSQCYHFEPQSQTMTVSNACKLIMKRSAKLEQIKSAEFIGILVGSIAVRGHVEIRTKMEQLIQSAGKKSRAYAMSRINEAKLANLSVPDVIVYIDCPHNTLFDRNEDPFLYKRLVTPWEIETALNPNVEWSPSFELDFRQFLPHGSLYAPPPQFQDLEENSHEDNGEQRVCIRMAGIVSTTGGQTLANASWKGLDPTMEAPHEIGTIVEGRTGIASAYSQELA